jgi:hypothetical protein
VVTLLETGLRTATYKLATLMALIDHAIEHVPEDADATLEVPIPQLAHRPCLGHHSRSSRLLQALAAVADFPPLLPAYRISAVESGLTNL